MTTNEIYNAACNMFVKALTENYNLNNGDPSVSYSSVRKLVERLQKAYEWCKQNGKGEQFEYFCSRRASGYGTYLYSKEVFDGVFKKEGNYA